MYETKDINSEVPVANQKKKNKPKEKELKPQPLTFLE